MVESLGAESLYVSDAAVTESGAAALAIGSDVEVEVVVVVLSEVSGVATVIGSGAAGPAPGAPDRLISSRGVFFHTLSVTPVGLVFSAVSIVLEVCGPEIAVSGVSGRMGKPVEVVSSLAVVDA